MTQLAPDRRTTELAAAFVDLRTALGRVLIGQDDAATGLTLALLAEQHAYLGGSARLRQVGACRGPGHAVGRPHAHAGVPPRHSGNGPARRRSAEPPPPPWPRAPPTGADSRAPAPGRSRPARGSAAFPRRGSGTATPDPRRTARAGAAVAAGISAGNRTARAGRSPDRPTRTRPARPLRRAASSERPAHRWALRRGRRSARTGRLPESRRVPASGRPPAAPTPPRRQAPHRDPR